MLNTDLDADALAERYAESRRIRIEGILAPDVAERIRAACLEQVPYDLITYVDDRPVETPRRTSRRCRGRRSRRCSSR